jgi:4-carboxymuconolactone decarboxylase
VAADELSDEQRELVGQVGLAPSLHIFTTLARHPALMRRWLPFGGKLLQAGTLSARDRELVILRVAWLCRAAYEWAQHVAIAKAAGLTDEEILRVPGGPDGSGWSDDDQTLLRAVDELHADHCISDGTWAALANRYTEKQLIELPMLAGHYALLAGCLNSWGVQPEPGGPALGQV